MAKKENDSIPLLQKYLMKNIKELRISYGYSQMKLAELAEKSTTFIGEIEKGKKYPSAKTLQKLSEALGVRPYQLFLSSEDGKEFQKVEILTSIGKELESKLVENIKNTIKKFLI